MDLGFHHAAARVGELERHRAGVVLQRDDDPERLVGVWHTAPGLGFDMVNQSPALHYTYLEENRVFESIGMWDNDSDSVTGLDWQGCQAGRTGTDCSGSSCRQ